jgi:hypothetical protein
MRTIFTSSWRFACLFFVCSLADSAAFAKLGYYYVIHARLEMKNGTFRDGYFNYAVIDAITTTKLALRDRAWIKSSIVFREPSGGINICSPDAIGFQKRSATAAALLTDLLAIEEAHTLSVNLKESDKLVLKQLAIIEKLRLHHVIIYPSCGS